MTSGLPHTQVWDYSYLMDDEGIQVEFRLTYRGPLPADSSHRSERHSDRMVAVKHDIRVALHPQIENFWKSHPSTKIPGNAANAKFTEQGLSFWEHYANQHKVVDKSSRIHRFAPLITGKNCYGCAVNVLFLRRDMPDMPLIHQGDLDNRIKILFDALRMPSCTKELVDSPQPTEQNPCFCLVENDKYIDHVSVTTDRLLAPVGEKESIEDVIIVVHVVARVMDYELYFSPI